MQILVKLWPHDHNKQNVMEEPIRMTVKIFSIYWKFLRSEKFLRQCYHWALNIRDLRYLNIWILMTSSLGLDGLREK